MKYLYKFSEKEKTPEILTEELNEFNETPIKKSPIKVISTIAKKIQTF